MPFTTVEELTGAAEMLGGRVKTLHPVDPRRHPRPPRPRRRHARRSRSTASSRSTWSSATCIRSAHVANRRGVAEAEVIANIDVGGPTMVRAAAKNFDSVAVVTDPERYGFLLDELRARAASVVRRDAPRPRGRGLRAHGRLRRRHLRRGSRTPTPSPSGSCSTWSRPATWPTARTRTSAPPSTSRPGARRHLLSRIEQLGGRALSFNNLWRPERGALRRRGLPGAGLRHRQARATRAAPRSARRSRRPTREALAADPRLGLRRRDRRQPARSPRSWRRALHEQFVEVLFAPGYDDAGARGAAREGRACGSSRTASGARPARASATSAACWAACSIQDRDTDLDDRDAMRVVSEAAPDERGWGDLLFAWRLCKYVRSNAIVIARDLASVGIGAGQMQPRRRGAAGGREGRRPGVRRRAGLRRVLPVRRRPAGRRRPPASRRSSSPAARSATTR